MSKSVSKKKVMLIYVTVFGETNRLARKTIFFFIALLPFTSSKDAAVPPSKFEANPTLCLQVKRASLKKT